MVLPWWQFQCLILVVCFYESISKNALQEEIMVQPTWTPALTTQFVTVYLGHLRQSLFEKKLIKTYDQNQYLVVLANSSSSTSQKISSEPVDSSLQQLLVHIYNVDQYLVVLANSSSSTSQKISSKPVDSSLQQLLVHIYNFDQDELESMLASNSRTKLKERFSNVYYNHPHLLHKLSTGRGWRFQSYQLISIQVVSPQDIEVS
jgi:hypothetical protein